MSIEYGLPAHIYHAGPEISKSQLDWIGAKPDGCPALYRWNKENPPAATPAMKLGTLVHTMLLEPERVLVQPVRPSVDLRLKANRSAKEEYDTALREHMEALTDDHVSCTQAEYETAALMRDSLLTHRIMQVLMQHGEPEVSIYWDWEGEPCRARPDWLDLATHRLAVDVKTTRHLGPRAFARTMADFRYHVTHAFYVDAIKAATDTDVKYLFAAVQNAPPYCSALYCLDANPDDVKLGRMLYKRDIRFLQECRERDEWPGPVGEEVQSIELPQWVYSDD